MNGENLRRRPHKIRGRNDAWWCEEPEGISVYQEVETFQGTIKVSDITIPWRFIRQALDRLDRPS